MGNGSALVVQPIVKALSLNAHSDENLIKAIAAGDREAMRMLYARHSVRVFRFISRLVADPSSAEDLVSEVFIDVWGQAGRFEGRSQVTTWILSIARFKALSALQRHRLRDAELDETAMELIEDAADSPEQTVLNSDLSAQLPVANVSGAPGGYRSRVLSRNNDRGGGRHHADAEKYREDPCALCPQAIGGAAIDAQ
jgi:RNA polymerase sigma-70 factor, ECF subfamily